MMMFVGATHAITINNKHIQMKQNNNNNNVANIRNIYSFIEEEQLKKNEGG